MVEICDTKDVKKRFPFNIHIGLDQDLIYTYNSTKVNQKVKSSLRMPIVVHKNSGIGTL